MLKTEHFDDFFISGALIAQEEGYEGKAWRDLAAYISSLSHVSQRKQPNTNSSKTTSVVCHIFHKETKKYKFNYKYINSLSHISQRKQTQIHKYKQRQKCQPCYFCIKNCINHQWYLCVKIV